MLFEPALPIGDRRACIRSMESLSKQLFAAACDRTLSHVRSSSNPLNGKCYMWWDLLVPYDLGRNAAKPKGHAEPDHVLIQKCMLETMAAILKIDHPACQESALHGLGHSHEIYPLESAAIIRRFLAGKQAIPRELVRYAEFAMEGGVQ